VVVMKLDLPEKTSLLEKMKIEAPAEMELV
jgi:hypothetical protein